MHLQMRALPRSSPPDLLLFLSRLKDDQVNLVSVGGSNVEFGGEFAFVPVDADIEKAKQSLERNGYTYRVLHIADGQGIDEGLDLLELDDTVGALHDALVAVAQKNLDKGRIIRDVLVGRPTDETTPGKIPVHIFSEEVRTPASMGSGTAG
jgi:hypothetical protein